MCILKCDRLEPLLEVIRFFYEDKLVSDVYSYIGLSYSNLIKDRLDEKKEKELKNRKLPYLSSRFSIKMGNKANQFFQSYLPHTYSENFIFGNWNSRCSTKMERLP